MPIKPASPKSASPKSIAAKAARAAKPAAAGKSPKSPMAKSAGPKSAAVTAAPMDDMSTGEADAPMGQAEADMGKKGATVVRLKDLIDQVATACGSKRQDVKAIVEATLAQIGGALGRGESMSLQGFGNFRVVRAATEENPVIRLKLRLTDGSKSKAASVPASVEEE